MIVTSIAAVAFGYPKEDNMDICDLCNTPIERDAKRYSASQMKIAVRKGLRPPATTVQLGAALGLSRDEVLATWIQRVMADTTDWAFCPSCAAMIEQCLSQAKKWWQFWK